LWSGSGTYLGGKLIYCGYTKDISGINPCYELSKGSGEWIQRQSLPSDPLRDNLRFRGSNVADVFNGEEEWVVTGGNSMGDYVFTLAAGTTPFLRVNQGAIVASSTLKSS